MIWLVTTAFCTLFVGAQESPPVPEYPYPKNYQKPSRKKKPHPVEAPVRKGIDGSYYYDTKSTKNKKTIPGIEQPSGVSKDGSYFYENNIKPKKRRSKNYRVEKDGSHYYDKDSQTKIHKHNGVEDPDHVKSDGSYFYKKDNTKYSKVFYFRGGVMGPYDVRGSEESPIGFKEVYSGNPELVLNFEYEWKLSEALGAFLFKVGSGFSFIQGKGRFASTENESLIPKESYQFIMVPTVALLSYKFDYEPDQWVIPYLEGGVGYFGFWEKRSDDKKNSFGGAPVLAGSLGILISMDAMGLGVDSDEGYSRSWVDIQVRQILGLSQRKDFTSTAITFGLGLGF